MRSGALSLQHSRGFSLLEVMISVGILSVALLGTAGLMAASLRSTNTAYQRTQATILADDILDRMRTNMAVAQGGGYDIDRYDPAAGPDLTTKTNKLAAYDCEEWTDMIADTLPGGVGMVSVNGDKVVTVELEWDNGSNSFTTETHL